MLRTVRRLSPTLAISIFNKTNELDSNLLQQKAASTPQTGWERVKLMYTRDEYDEPSTELNTVVQATSCGFFFGAAFGGLVQGRHAYLNFIENNQATIFNTTREAQKKLQDAVTIAFARGAYHWGWRLGIFTGMFSAIATTLSVYRNDTSIMEYVIAGAMTGALYKANLGTAAMLVGGVLGGVLSTIGGLVILALLKISGTTMTEVRKSLYKLKQARVDQYNQAIEKSATEKHDNLTRHHDQIVEEKGEVKVEQLP